MSEPDWDALQAANDELRELHDAGKLTRKAYDRLLEDATTAVGDREEYLEGILMRGLELGFVEP